MSGEQQQSATENTAVEDDNDDADFAAGFSGAAEEPTATPALTPEPTAAPTPVPTAAPAPEYVQITREEWDSTKARAAKVDEIDATHRQRLDQVFGKMGGLERRITELTAATPSGEAVQISDADFEELKKDYPELVPFMTKDLNKILGRMKGAAGLDTDAVTKLVGEKIQAASQEIRAQTVEASLEAVFPGWKEEVRTPQFATWINSQAADVKALASSDKVGDAAKMLRLYDTAKSAPAATPAPSPAPTPAPTQAPPSSTRQRQVAAAVPPRGDGGHPPASGEDDDFEQGYRTRSVRG